MVRGCLSRGKRRLFSRAFLDEQRRDRNRYRESVRSIQTFSGDKAPLANLDWNEPVPARIPVGAVVTAFNAKYRILQRGVTLSHDAKRNMYFVQFPPGYGKLWCPDYEVARHGLPELLTPGSTPFLKNPTRPGGNGHPPISSSLIISGTEGYGTSLGYLSRKCLYTWHLNFSVCHY